MTYQTYDDPVSHLPDPIRQPEFYDSVSAKRLLAWIVDSILTLSLVLVALPFTAFTGVFFLPVMYLVIGFAYRTVTIAGRSATLGMRLMAMELRQPDGRRFDLQAAFLHTLGYTVSVSVPVLQVISVLLMLTTARGQGLTDHVLGTAALNRRR
jgi:uncharacterized RDD family membrane protein YckC